MNHNFLWTARKISITPFFLFVLLQSFSAYAGQIFFLDSNIFDVEEFVVVSGELDRIESCSDPNGIAENKLDLFPSASIYVVAGGTVSANTQFPVELIDLSGNSNIVQGALTGGAFIDQIIASTVPLPNGLVGGTYQAILDECRDGSFTPGEDNFVEFTVFIPVDILPLPSEAMLSVKQKARDRAISGIKAGMGATLVFVIDNIVQIYKQLKELKPKDAAGNIKVVRNLVCSLFGLEFADFINDLNKVLQEKTDNELSIPSLQSFSFNANTGELARDDLISFLACKFSIKPKDLLGNIAPSNPFEVSIGDRIRLQQKTILALIKDVQHHFDIADDPPDPNFSQPVYVGAIDHFFAVTGDPVEFTMVDMARNLALSEALSEAFLASLEKYQGARAYADPEAALVHARGIKEYALLLSGSLEEANQIIDIFLGALINSDRDMNALVSIVQPAISRVGANGFNDDEIELLLNLGATKLGMDITELLLADLDLTAFDEGGGLVGLLVDSQDHNDTYAEALQDLAQDMDILIADIESKISIIPPLAQAGGPYEGAEGMPVLFNGSGSQNYTNGSLNYEWDLDGDGEFDDAFDQTPSFTYNTSVSRLVGLRVTDNASRIGISYTLLKLTEDNLPPVIEAFSPSSDELLNMEVGSSLAFSIQTSDPDNDPVSIKWFIDDEERGSGAIFFYEALVPGVRALRVEASDGHILGGKSIQVREVFVVAPNLVIDHFTSTPLFPTDADIATLSAEVKNDGLVDAENIAVTFSIDSDPLGTPHTIASLAAGESTTLSVDIDLSGRTGQIPFFIVEVDPANSIAESDEDDNVQTSAFYVRRSTPFAGPGVNWSTEKLIDGSGGTGQLQHSLVIDSDGNERFVYTYWDRNYGKVWGYARRWATGWKYSIVDTQCCSGGAGSSSGSHLDLDSSGRPHVAYSWADPASAATGARYAVLGDNGQWQIQVVEQGNGGSASYGDNPVIALGADDRPHMIFNTWGLLRYALYDGIQWNIQNVATIGQLGNADLALDSQGRPHVVYQGTGGIGTVYAVLDNGQWHKQTIGGQGTNWTTTSIAIDPDDHIHVSFWVENDKQYKYGFYDGNEWTIEVIDGHDLATNMSTIAHLALTSAGEPVVTYPVGTANRSSISLRYARRTGDGVWHIQTIDSATENYATGISNSVALTANDEPRVLYNMGNQTRLASGQPEVPQTGTPGFNVPAPLANGPYSGYEGEPLFVDALGSGDPDGDALQYRWDFEGDGVFESPFSASSETSFIYADDFNGSVAVEAVDPTGLSGVAISSIQIANVAPAVDAGFGGSVELGQSFALSASFTDPGVADTHLWKINWGDDRSSLGMDLKNEGVNEIQAEHVFAVAGDYTITVTVTDDDGGQGSDQVYVRVEAPVPADTTPPVISLNGANPLFVECGEPFFDPGATASDGFDGDLSNAISSSGQVDARAPGTYAIAYAVSDFTGNASTATRTVIVQDTTPPVIALAGASEMALECHIDAYQEPGVSAEDACDGVIEISVNSQVDASALGTYVLTYTATDAAGNTATATRSVNVVDTTPPTIALNGNNPLVLECHIDAYQEADAIAIDACDGAVQVAITGQVDASAPGTYLLTYTATDAVGNTATVTRSVHVVDTIPPTIALSGEAEITLECGLEYLDAGATATDACDGDLTASIAVEGSVDPFAIGSYVLTYVATDAAGNTAAIARSVNVVDTTPPTIALNGANPLVLECNIDSYRELGATATDNGKETPTLTITGQVDISALGTYVLTYTASDAAGNVATVTRIVNVVDTTPPTIALNGDNPLILECNIDSYQEPGAIVIDAGDEAPLLTISGQVEVALGSYVLTYTATDAAGNTVAIARSVNVVDTTPPTVTINSPVTGAKFFSNQQIDIVYAVTDICDETPTIAIEPGDPHGPPLAVGELILSVVATDDSGNKTMASVAVIVEPIVVGFDFDPNTLNIANGNGITTGHIELAGAGGICTDIDLHSLVLEGPLGNAYPITDARFGFVSSKDGYCDGPSKRLVKFQRADVVDIVEEPGSVLTIRGNYLASSPFGAAAIEGTDEIRVIAKGGGKGHAKLIADAVDTYELFPSYPNPFNAETQIIYQIPEPGALSLIIYNMAGQQVRMLVQGEHAAGRYQAVWDGRDERGAPASSGMYFYRFTSDGLLQTRRMILLK